VSAFSTPSELAYHRLLGNNEDCAGTDAGIESLRPRPRTPPVDCRTAIPLMSLGLGGPLATWIRNYAILFYADHYPEDALNQSPRDR
jgi:hypothetical protein